MAYERTSTALKCLPSATDGLAVTPNGTAWNNSSWVQVTASTANAICPAGILVSVPGGTGNNGHFEVDIGIGGAGSEVVIGTLAGISLNGRGSAMLWFRIPINAVPTSTRVSIRMRKNGTTTTTWNFKLVYFDGIPSGVTLTTAVCKVAPSAAAGAAPVTNASAWVSGTYVDLIASTPAAIVIVGIVVIQGSAGAGNNYWELDIAKGAAASEVVLDTFKGRNDGNDGGMNYFFLPSPIDNVGASVRVSCRARQSVASAGTFSVKLVYLEKPL